MIELQKREAKAEVETARAAVKQNQKLIYESPRGVVVGNPKNGDVTLVEFFDYNCGYCKRALDDMMTLTKADPKLKFVLKEFPVLGPGSESKRPRSPSPCACRTRTAANTRFPPASARHARRSEQRRALAAAKDAGLDMARIERDLKSDEIRATLDESASSRMRLGISGTPSYVVGDEVVPGAVGASSLAKIVDAVRKCGAATC